MRRVVAYSDPWVRQSLVPRQFQAMMSAYDTSIFVVSFIFRRQPHLLIKFPEVALLLMSEVS